MHRLIQEKIADIAALCRRYHVRSLEVFGSAARSESFDPTRSDVDFLVEFEARTDLSPLEEFFSLQTDLSRLLERPVDLVEIGAIRNPYVLAGINQAREIVYAA
ncbi:MAG: nucleotidyltransferase domain-containing protein [Candidatus Competibacteraceae bacterium]